MLAIFTRALTFVHPDTYAGYRHTDDLKQTFPRVTNKSTFKVQPSRDPQNAPEWIRATTEFKLACSDGSVREFVATGDGGVRIDWPEPEAGQVEFANIPRALPPMPGMAQNTRTTILSGSATDPQTGKPLGIPEKAKSAGARK